MGPKDLSLSKKDLPLSKKDLPNKSEHGHLLHPGTLRRASGSSRALLFSPELLAATPALLWVPLVMAVGPRVMSRDYIHLQDPRFSLKPLQMFSHASLKPEGRHKQATSKGSLATLSLPSLRGSWSVGIMVSDTRQIRV